MIQFLQIPQEEFNFLGNVIDDKYSIKFSTPQVLDRNDILQAGFRKSLCNFSHSLNLQLDKCFLEERSLMYLFKKLQMHRDTFSIFASVA